MTNHGCSDYGIGRHFLEKMHEAYHLKKNKLVAHDKI